MFKWLKKTAAKADDALDQAKKSIDASEKSVKTIINILSIALVVSIVTNIVTISTTFSNKKISPNTITIENLYLGGPY